MNEEEYIDQLLARRRETEALRYVEFNPCVERYAQAWAKYSYRTVLFIAPNAVGKTYGTVALMGWTMWPQMAPEWFRKKMNEKFERFPKSIRVCSTVEEVGEAGSLQKAITKLWPQGRYTSEKKRKHYPSIFKTDTKWTVDIMTYDQEKKEFEGGDRGLVVFNEPPPKDIYTACIARTRMGGMMVFPGTPLYDSAWIKDDLVDKALTDHAGVNGQSSIGVVGGELEEACKDHSKNGHLEHSEIERLKNSYDMDEYDARVRGKFMHLSGLVYRNFSHEFVSKGPVPFDPNGLQFQVIDPAGFNKPFAIIWGQVVPNPMNGIRILREWPDGSQGVDHYFEHMKEPNMKVEDYANLFSEVERQLGFTKSKVHRILDRRFGHNRDNTSGLSLREHFYEEGYDFNDSYNVPEKMPELKTGITAVKNYLKTDPMTNLPYLILDPSCVNVRRSFERWCIDPVTQKPKDDVYKNFQDVVRYAAAANLDCSPSSSENWNQYEAPSWSVEGYGN